MQFNTAQLLLGPTGDSRRYEIDDDITGLDPDLHPLGRLIGRVKFTKTDYKILVTGTLEAEMQIECQRCLAAFTQDVTISLEEEFQPKIDVRTGAALDEDDVDPALVIDERNILDLSEVVRQSLLLAAGEFLTCRVDCEGLCVQCGANLNEAKCACDQESIDPRWADMDELLRSRSK
jgi:uncharacterized protein